MMASEQSMTHNPNNIDIDQLKKTLYALEYNEPLNQESAPLVHHILLDLQNASRQYNELLENYDMLYDRYQSQVSPVPSLMNNNKMNNNNQNDINVLESLSSFFDDDSFVGHSALNGGNIVDDSFMLQAVEQARERIESLTTQLESANALNEQLNTQKQTITSQLEKAQKDSSELASRLHTSNLQIDTLSSKLKSAQQSLQDPAKVSELKRIVNEALSLLPASAQAIFKDRINTAESSDDRDQQQSPHLLGILQNILEKLKVEHSTMKTLLTTLNANIESLKSKNVSLQQEVAKEKALVDQSSTKINQLNAMIAQKQFEASLGSSMSDQLRSLESLNAKLHSKLGTLQSIQSSNINNDSSTTTTILSTLVNELGTEISFTGHLSEMVQKLNDRRLEQEVEVKKTNEQLTISQKEKGQLELEKIELEAKLDLATTNTHSQEQSINETAKTIDSLQRNIAEKKEKINLLQKNCEELKATMDASHKSMASMRRNEELIRGHVVSQDQEIKSLRMRLEALKREKENIENSHKDSHRQQSELNQKINKLQEQESSLSLKLHELGAEKERLAIECRTAKDKAADLQEVLNGKKREKDLLMTTYCRVIKENERLAASLQSEQDKQYKLQAGDTSLMRDRELKAMESKIQVQSLEIERLHEGIREETNKVSSLQSKLASTEKTREASQQECAQLRKKIKNQQSIISTLERSKRDLAAQMTRFGDQARDLRDHLRRIETERLSLATQLRQNSSEADNSGNNRHHIASRLGSMGGEIEALKRDLRLLDLEKRDLEDTLAVERKKSNLLLEKLEAIKKRSSSPLPSQTNHYTRDSQSPHLPHQHYAHKKGQGVYNAADSASISPPESPPHPKEGHQHKGTGNAKDNKSHKLHQQNQSLKRHLEEIRREMRQEYSPTKAGEIADELESSLTALSTSGDSIEDYGVNTNDIERRLEHENRILFRIVEKVKKDLENAGIDTSIPTSISTSSNV